MKHLSQRYALIGTLGAVFFWFLDSSIHFILYREPEFEFIPGDGNELWMRTAIFVLLIAFGFYAQFSTKRLLDAEQQ